MIKLSKAIRELGQKRSSLRRKGGVDAGRDIFIRVGDREFDKKRNPIARLVLSWRQKKSAPHSHYQAEKKRPGWRRLSVLLLCLICVVALFIGSGGPTRTIDFLKTLDYFKITSISIRGCRKTPVEKIRTSSGVTISTSLLAVRESTVSQSIRDVNNWVKSVRVLKHWPDSLIIKVNEYEPHALLAVGSGEQASLYYLDRSGEPFVKAGSGPDLDYPIITGLETASEDERASQLKQPLYFLNLVSANNPNLPAQSVSEVHLSESEGMVIYLVEHPFPIFLGEGDIREKYIRLRKVLEILYKPRKTGMDIARVAYIRMDYLRDKVIVGYSESG